MQLGSRIKCVSFNHSRIRVCRYISLRILLDISQVIVLREAKSLNLRIFAKRDILLYVSLV